MPFPLAQGLDTGPIVDPATQAHSWHFLTRQQRQKALIGEVKSTFHDTRAWIWYVPEEPMHLGACDLTYKEAAAQANAFMTEEQFRIAFTWDPETNQSTCDLALPSGPILDSQVSRRPPPARNSRTSSRGAKSAIQSPTPDVIGALAQLVEALRTLMSLLG